MPAFSVIHGGERLLQIRDQIAAVLRTDRDANQTPGQTHAVQILVGEVVGEGDSGVGERCTNAAQGSQITDQLQALHEFCDLFKIVLQPEAQHGSIAVVRIEHPGGQLVVGVLRQTRMVYLFHVRILRQRLRDENGVLILGTDSHAHGLDGPKGHPGSHGIQAAAQQQILRIDPVDQRCGSGQASAGDVAVSAEIQMVW